MPVPAHSPRPLTPSAFARRSAHSYSVRWVYDVVRSELTSGAFAENVLPPEDVMMRRYAVSRGTIRRVVELLRTQGLIERLRGAGTFILTPPTLDHGIDTSRDIAQDVNVRGQRVSIFKTHCQSHPATDFVAEKLEVRPRDEVVILETLTYLDGFPLSLRTAFMPLPTFRVLLEADFDTDRSPYLVMQDVLGEHPGETDLHISASTADEVVAEMLQISAGSALMDSTRVVYSLAGRPVEYSVAHARGDRMVFSTVMEPLGRPQWAAGA